MAMRLGKLFPAPTQTNQTGDCQGFCEAACPQSCYNFLSPPPPPPHPLSQTPNVAPYVIVVLIILAILCLAISIYLLVVKSRSGWFRSRNNRQEPESQTNNRDEELLDEIRTVVHPVWFIARMGLQQSTIDSIAVIKYRKGEGLIEGTECSVCLNEFQEDESLRLLPKCNHAFHISCIDTWLRSHTNCPLCRANIVDVVVDAPLISVNRNSDILNAVVGPQVENLETNVELGNAQERNIQACESRGGAGDEEGEVRHVGDKGHSNALGLPIVGPGEGSNVPRETILKEEVDSDGNVDRQLACETDDDNKEVQDDTQQTRRSLSLDYLTDASLRLDADNHSQVESQGSLANQTENT